MRDDINKGQNRRTARRVGKMKEHKRNDKKKEKQIFVCAVVSLWKYRPAPGCSPAVGLPADTPVSCFVEFCCVLFSSGGLAALLQSQELPLPVISGSKP